LIVLALAACAEKFVLGGSPDVAGLLVVDAEVSTKSFMGDKSDSTPVNVVIRKVIGDVLIEGERVGDLFVFQGLKPGRYQLVSVSTKRGKKETALAVPSESEEQFTFEVAAGVPLYLGVVTIQQDMQLKELGVHYQLNADASRARAAWKSLIEQQTRSRWKPVLERHLGTL
jgi:hypothetical protein